MVNNLAATTSNVTGLTANTSYEFYVRAVCGIADSSLWAGPFTFTTGISCPEPTNLSALNVSFTAANAIFQAGSSESEWNIEWGTNGFTVDNGEEEGSINK